MRAGVESREMHFAAFRWEWESHLDMCFLGVTATSTWSLGGKLLSLVVLIAFSDAFAFQPIWSVILVLYAGSEIPCSEH